MARSLRVQQDCIHKVKLALNRSGFPSQRSWAEDVGFALATVNKFLTGKPVDYTTQILPPEPICAGENESIVLTLSTIGFANGTLRERAGSTKDFLPSDTSPRYPNGAVPLGSPFYLERTTFEAQLDREISKPGALVRIEAPREMGKTSLLLRVLASAQSLGYHTVSLNLAQVDGSRSIDLDRFLRCICTNVARQLQLKPILDDYWDEDLGSKFSCSERLEALLRPNKLDVNSESTSRKLTKRFLQQSK